MYPLKVIYTAGRKEGLSFYFTKLEFKDMPK